jgi:hypothetical protein
MASQQLAYLLVMVDLMDFLMMAQLGELPLVAKSMLVIFLMVEMVEFYV